VLDARAKTVREIMHSGDQYLIPFFQRSYSWESKHWQRILEDVDALAEVAPERLHFLGPLVCASTAHVPGEVASYQLIDGQQRLTTLTLMLCAIRELARDNNLVDLAEEITDDFLIQKRRPGLSRYKVVPRLGDREALLAILDSKDIGQWRDLQVTKCLRFFAREFRKRAAQDATTVLPRLFSDITARMALVVVTVAHENPYEIFDSLNSTGLPLEQSDLVRNFVFMQVPLQDQQAFYDEHWRPFEVLFDAAGEYEGINATSFYRDYLLREGVYLQTKDTYVDFRNQNTRRGLSPQAQVQELRRFLGFELWLRRPATCPDGRIRARLIELSQLDVATAHPLVLALLSLVSDGTLPVEGFEEAMRDLSSFVIRRSLTGESTRAYGRWFAEAVKRIGTNVVDDLRGVWSGRGWPSDRDLVRRLHEFPIYRREPEKCRLILDRLEESYGHKEKVDRSTLTIEHVLPQTIDEAAAGAMWKEALGADWFHVQQRWVHSLGNLTLTGYNSEMSNSAYATKKKALVASNLLLNSYFKELEHWDAKTIEIRGQALAEEVCALWPNPRQPEPGAEDVVEEGHVPARPNFDVERLRSQSVERLARVVGTGVSRLGYARYASPDGREHFLCVSSQPYVHGQSEGYWFGVAPMQLEFLQAAPRAHVAICCGSPDRILWIPRDEFLGFVENMNRTGERHWHIQIHKDGSDLLLDQPKKRTKENVSRYLLPIGRSHRPEASSSTTDEETSA
jgi:hypothetical protein